MGVLCVKVFTPCQKLARRNDRHKTRQVKSVQSTFSSNQSVARDYALGCVTLSQTSREQKKVRGKSLSSQENCTRMWNCVEEQVENGTKYGRIVRKIIFGDIFADRTSVLKQKPIAKVEQKLLKRGDTIAYLEQDEIREARFLCSNSEQNDAKYVITELLTSEDDIKEWYNGGLDKTNSL